MTRVAELLEAGWAGKLQWLGWGQFLPGIAPPENAWVNVYPHDTEVMLNKYGPSRFRIRPDPEVPAVQVDTSYLAMTSMVDAAMVEMHDIFPPLTRSQCKRLICAALSATLPDAEQEKLAMLGQPYGIVDPDYARVYTQARIVAWSYGYACVMHGSFTRDLDLLLVPWTDKAQDNHEQLLRLIAEACDLTFSDGEDVYKARVDFSEKPWGRKSCSLYFKKLADRRWVDISIVPRVRVEPAQKE